MASQRAQEDVVAYALSTSGRGFLTGPWGREALPSAGLPLRTAAHSHSFNSAIIS